MKLLKTKEIVYTALGVALVFAATILIRVPDPIGGYLNLGDGILLLFASFLSPFSAFLIGGLGSALADMAGGYGIYFLASLLIKGSEGILTALLLRRFKQGMLRKAVYLLASLLMVGGYYLCDSLLQGSWISALQGVPSNALQGLLGIVIALCTAPLLRKVKRP